MDYAVAVFVFYLGIAEILISGYLFWVAYGAMKRAQGKPFCQTMRLLCVAALLFIAAQASSMFQLMRADMLGVIGVLSSRLLVLLLISAVRELSDVKMVHEHLMKHRRHGKRDVE